MRRQALPGRRDIPSRLDSSPNFEQSQVVDQRATPSDAPALSPSDRFFARRAITDPRGDAAPRGESHVPLDARSIASETSQGRDSARLSVFGPLTALVRDPAVTDIFVNGSHGLWVDRGTGLARLGTFRPGEAAAGLTEPDVRALAVRLVAAGGRHVDESSPCIDVRLDDGIRVHAVLPPISPHGTLLSVRLPRVTRLSISDLEASGFFGSVPSDPIRRLVLERRNILLTGAGGSGKTTALAALLSLADPADRIVTIEDVAELRIDHPHVVALESRQANLEGVGEIGLTRLVREALRMRPDRLVLGECRGAEIRELLAALNTGHDGGAGTLHANSLGDVPARLEALGALAGLGPTEIARQAVSAIHSVIHLERRGAGRRIAHIGRFALDTRDRLIMVDVVGQVDSMKPRHGA